MKNRMRRFICRIRGHKFTVLRYFSRDIRKIGCDRCDLMWAANDRVKKMVPWTPRFEVQALAWDAAAQGSRKISDFVSRSNRRTKERRGSKNLRK